MYDLSYIYLGVVCKIKGTYTDKKNIDKFTCFKMMKEKQIEKFISRSIKAGGEFSYDYELQILIDQMTTDEISIFWFISGKVFSETNSNIPHWKTSDQEKYYKIRNNDLTFYPKEKDSNGKYIIDRNDLIRHVVGHITNHIKENIQTQDSFKNSSLLEKLPFYTLASTFVIIPAFIICSLFPKNQICNLIILFCYIIFGVNILLYSIARYFINKK